MNHDLKELMRDATRLTRGGQLQEATALLQRFLGGSADAAPSRPAPQPPGDVIDGCVFELKPPREAMPAEPGTASAESGPGQFLSGAHTHASLTRQYKLYVPPGAPQGRPLVVMLHGCTQNPDDVATGTGMNELAQAQGFYVLYPAQSGEANSSRCWNWFKHNHQQRDRGEPALIASLTRMLVREHGIDASRVFVAGLSAGGAMAAIMGAAYPDLYAAAGVHSGLAPGVAGNVGEALSAMNGAAGSGLPLGSGLGARPKLQALGVPTIVFHGDQDKTVKPGNGSQVIEARLLASGAAPSATVDQGLSPKGRRFTRRVHSDGHGRVLAEHWVIHGAGHAWSGGRPTGSFTDALGPDASAEMLRFFLEHPRDKPGG